MDTVELGLGMQYIVDINSVQLGFGIVSLTLKLKRFGVLVSIVSVKKVFTEARENKVEWFGMRYLLGASPRL